MVVRLLREWDDDDGVKDKASRLMNHREERMLETQDWDRVDQVIVQPILEMTSDWSQQEVEDCVGFIRCMRSEDLMTQFTLCFQNQRLQHSGLIVRSR